MDKKSIISCISVSIFISVLGSIMLFIFIFKSLLNLVTGLFGL